VQEAGKASMVRGRKEGRSLESWWPRSFQGCSLGTFDHTRLFARWAHRVLLTETTHRKAALLMVWQRRHVTLRTITTTLVEQRTASKYYCPQMASRTLADRTSTHTGREMGSYVPCISRILPPWMGLRFHTTLVARTMAAPISRHWSTQIVDLQTLC